MNAASSTGRPKIRMGTFNVHNLAKAGVRFYDDQPPYSEAAYQAKCQWLAKTIDAMRADLIVFQEVFHREALARVLELSDYAKKEPRMKMFVREGDETSPKVCMATRYEVRECTWIRDVPSNVVHGFDARTQPICIDGKPIDTMSRPVLRARVLVPELGDGSEMIVYGVHLKSKNPDGFGATSDLRDPIGQVRSLVRRAVEAVAVRAFVLGDLRPAGAEGAAGRPVVLCGDCNDDTIAVTTQILLGKRSDGYAKLLRSALELHSSRSLYSAYYTYIFDGHYEALDHILLSDHFSPGNDARLGDVEYVRFFTDHLVDQQLYRDTLLRDQSDHAAVTVTIKPRTRTGP